MFGTLQGEFFGELALITNERRSATICAGGDTTLDVFTLLKHDFETVVSTFPKLNEMVRGYYSFHSLQSTGACTINRPLITMHD